MRITIDKKNYKIKPATELTVKEYNKFFSTISGTSNSEYLICYLGVITGLEFSRLNSFNIDDNSFRRLIFYIGQILQPNEIPVSKEFLYRKKSITLNQKSVNWRTLGVRKFLEEKKECNQIEQTVYLLAIYLAKDYDSEKIEEIYQELQDYNAIEVISFSVFFFKKLFNGQKSVTNFLRMLLIKALIKIARRLKR